MRFDSEKDNKNMSGLLGINTLTLYAQVGIRIRVAAVTGLHDRPLHYLGMLVVPTPGIEPGTSR